MVALEALVSAEVGGSAYAAAILLESLLLCYNFANTQWEFGSFHYYLAD